MIFNWSDCSDYKLIYMHMYVGVLGPGWSFQAANLTITTTSLFQHTFVSPLGGRNRQVLLYIYIVSMDTYTACLMYNSKGQ